MPDSLAELLGQICLKFNISKPCYIVFSVTKWFRATRSEAEGARRRASFHSHMGLSNKATSRKILIFFYMVYGTIDVFLFEHTIDNRDELAQPDPTAQQPIVV